jgi:BlaI family transcriptional regulator, penicillinase repressor
MAHPRLTRLEFQIMDVLWAMGKASIREIQDSLPEGKLRAYTTIQTTVYRLENKDVVRRVAKVGNFHIFEPMISREKAQRKIIDDVLTFFGGQLQPVIARLIESDHITMDEIREVERILQNHLRKDKHP